MTGGREIRADDWSHKLGDIAASAGLRRVHVLAWRDLDDPEAGGSEVHAAEVTKRWAAAGIQVVMRTSAVPRGARSVRRDGVAVKREAGRYRVFPHAARLEALRPDRRDGLVEIWNGMPFFSPVWNRGPRCIWLHHVHGEMWRMALPGRLARVGEVVERRVAPPLYRGSPVVTLSESSRRRIVSDLGFDARRVRVVQPGVSARFSPGRRSEEPLIVAVGRLVPQKRFADLLDALFVLKCRHPELRAVIAGEGHLRPELEERIAGAGAGDWIRLPGRVSEDSLVELYQQAWVVAATSSHEGWGMTLTEAAACGTPAVATNIPGHADAVLPGVSGYLADDRTALTERLDQVLSDRGLRERLSAGALRFASTLTWDATAAGTLQVLAEDARRRR